MASFRASAAILGLTAGADPPEVLESARLAIGRHWHVEDSFVDVGPLARNGSPPRVTVRFVVPVTNDAEEDASAWRAARTMAADLGKVAAWTDLRVFRRDRGRWLPLERGT